MVRLRVAILMIAFAAIPAYSAPVTSEQRGVAQRAIEEVCWQPEFDAVV